MGLVRKLLKGGAGKTRFSLNFVGLDNFFVCMYYYGVPRFARKYPGVCFLQLSSFDHSAPLSHLPKQKDKMSVNIISTVWDLNFIFKVNPQI